MLVADKTLPNAMRYLGLGIKVIGVLCIVMAILVYSTAMDLPSLYDWLRGAFGPLFTIPFTLCVALGLMAIAKVRSGKQAQLWMEVGQQAANAIATLALTFTLLGISLGIGALAEQHLTPETIAQVIQELTQHFSTAFMTTVVGLPSAQAIRSVLAITWVKHHPQPI